jgi:hypothetical protein
LGVEEEQCPGPNPRTPSLLKKSRRRNYPAGGDLHLAAEAARWIDLPRA